MDIITDTERIDHLNFFIELGVASFGFELDGGVHGTFADMGGEPLIYREQPDLRHIIDAHIKATKEQNRVPMDASLKAQRERERVKVALHILFDNYNNMTRDEMVDLVVCALLGEFDTQIGQYAETP